MRSPGPTSASKRLDRQDQSSTGLAKPPRALESPPWGHIRATPEPSLANANQHS
jgi:hypothetical protein